MAADIVQHVFAQSNPTKGEDLSSVLPQVGLGYLEGVSPTAAPLIFTASGNLRASVANKDLTYYNETSPSTSSYSVRVGFTVVSSGQQEIAGVCVRMSSSDDSFYTFVLCDYTQIGQGLAFFKHVAGSPNPIGPLTLYPNVNNVPLFPIVGKTFVLELDVNGSTLTGKCNGYTVASVTNSEITATGFGGLYLLSSTADDTDGFQFQSFDVNDPNATVTPPVPPVPPQTSFSIVPQTATAFSGGPQIAVKATRINSTIGLDAKVTGNGTLSTTTPNSGSTFYYNPPATGSGTDTITVTDVTTFLTVTCVITYAPAPPGPQTITVDSLACGQSPGNWSGDSGRVGSEFRQSWNNGAWRSYSWNTPENVPIGKLLLSNPSAGATISYFLNGVLYDNITIPSDASGITLQGVQTGDNYLWYFLRNSVQANRWNLTNATKDEGLVVDPTATPGEVAARPWIMLIGNSITEGILANNGADDFLAAYSFGLTQAFDALGYDVCVSACGGSGWLRPGDNTTDVPAYYPSSGEARWNKINSGTTLLDSIQHISAFGSLGTEPTLIYIDYGTNECLTGIPSSLMQVAITGALIALRAAAPSAKIVVIVPFGLYAASIFPNGMLYVNAIKTALNNYATMYPSDNFTTLLDLGPKVSQALASPTYGASVHPNAAGHAYVTPLIMSGLNKALAIQPLPQEFVTVSVQPQLQFLESLSYVSVEIAGMYFQTRLNTDPWDYANPIDQNKSLIQATRAIDRLNFIGRKVNPNQPLQWPRVTKARSATGLFSTSNLIPNDIIIATCELALVLLDGVDPDLEDDLLSSQSDAYATVRVTSDANLAKDHVKAGIPSIEAWRHLLPWLNDPRAIHLRKG